MEAALRAATASSRSSRAEPPWGTPSGLACGELKRPQDPACLTWGNRLGLRPGMKGGRQVFPQLPNGETANFRFGTLASQTGSGRPDDERNLRLTVSRGQQLADAPLRAGQLARVAPITRSIP